MSAYVPTSDPPRATRDPDIGRDLASEFVTLAHIHRQHAAEHVAHVAHVPYRFGVIEGTFLGTAQVVVKAPSVVLAEYGGRPWDDLPLLLSRIVLVDRALDLGGVCSNVTTTAIPGDVPKLLVSCDVIDDGQAYPVDSDAIADVQRRHAEAVDAHHERHRLVTKPKTRSVVLDPEPEAGSTAWYDWFARRTAAEARGEHVPPVGATTDE